MTPPKSFPINPNLTNQEIEDEDQLSPMFEQITIKSSVSGPKEPPSDQSTSWPSWKIDKGKAKMTEYEDDQFDGNESTHSLNNEFGGFDVSIMKTLGVKKAIATENKKL